MAAAGHSFDPKKKVLTKLDGIMAMTEKIPTKISTVDYATLTEEEKRDKGLEWLTSMWQERQNGILGDQIGVWGIITTLTFIARLKEEGQHGPYLIVTSMANLFLDWATEINRFPSMKPLYYVGNRKDRAMNRKEFAHKTVGPDFPIVLTLHGTVLQDKKWLAQYDWKYVVVDEGGRQLDKRHREVLDEVKRQPMDHKLLLLWEPFQNNLAELWLLLNFALPSEFSSREEFDSWFDRSGIEGEVQQTEEERRALLSKLHAILRPFLLRDMKSDVKNRVPPMKEGTCYKTKVVQSSDAMSATCSNAHAAIKVARTGVQEVAAEVVAETGGEGSPNTQSSQPGLEVEGNKAIKRPWANDALISSVGKNNPVVHVQVREPTPSESIFKALEEIPGLARTDILRAYSTLIRDDRQFESLMTLPMDMRKDWLLMEIGNK